MEAAPLQPKEEKKDQKKDATNNNNDKNKKKEKKEEEMSEEDLKMKQNLDLLAERVQDKDAGVQKLALETLRGEIKSSTSSMTSVPKPLKFLRPHFSTLKTYFETLPESENKKILADILSVLAMTMSEQGTRESLKFKLAGYPDDLGSWGHEFVRNLAGEIGDEYAARTESEEKQQPVDDLYKLVDHVIPFYMAHNAEPDACDLLMEVEKLSQIVDHVDDKNFSRVCLYLLGCAKYVPEPEDTETLKVILSIYKKLQQIPDALRIAIALNDHEEIDQIFKSATDPLLQKQLAFLLGKQCLFNIETDNDQLNTIINNSSLNEHFLALAKELEVTEPKTPDDIYKSHLIETRSQYSSTGKNVALEALASNFVNAFVNTGFGTDKLMTDSGSKFLAKHKELVLTSATASLGMILLWDVEGGLNKLDKYLSSKDDFVKAGALLAVGIVNSSVKNDCDPARALLSEEFTSTNNNIKIGAIFGLGIAYSGTARQDLLELLTPIIEDSTLPIDVVSLAALALGQIFVSTANVEASNLLIQTLLERQMTDETSLHSTNARFFCLGLGLLFLGKQEAAEVTLEALKVITGGLGQYASLTVETCAYAGTGNVLKVQKMLGVAGEHPAQPAASAPAPSTSTTNAAGTPTTPAGATAAAPAATPATTAPAENIFNTSHQAASVLGIALISMGEEIGSEMALRAADHLLQYGEPSVRRAVPLALGLISVSNPRVTVMDSLSKFSHDSDPDVAMSAILSLGLIGAGTNNSRIAGLLRQLVAYYYKDPNHLFIVRIAQGLLHMGKGTLTLSPFNSHGLLMSRVAVSGLLIFLHAALDFKNLIQSKHYLLYSIVSAMSPRMLMTFDEDLKPVNIPVRVGQAVDTVGQAGRPKTITGFQTHNTPVLLGVGERAELATDDYIPYTNILEGFVILKKNPNSKAKTEATTAATTEAK